MENNAAYTYEYTPEYATARNWSKRKGYVLYTLGLNNFWYKN